MKPTRLELAVVLEEVDRAILELLGSVDSRDLSEHYDLALRQARFDATPQGLFQYFIGREKARFIKAINVISATRTSGSICDIGCFIPYLPLALRKLGYTVTIADNYQLFGKSMRDSIVGLASANDIRVLDVDILTDNVDRLGRHDVVLLMAVVEHLLGSPRQLLSDICRVVDPGGFLLFEVPNIAEFGKRIASLLGRSPLPDYAQYFWSTYPFFGHNREMTVAEVRYLLRNTGFEVKDLWCYDYWKPENPTLQMRLLELGKRLLPASDKAQAIMAKAYPVCAQ